MLSLPGLARTPRPLRAVADIRCIQPGHEPAVARWCQLPRCCIGKMLSPQSIALGVGAVGAVADGKEGEIMRGTVGYCLFLLIIAGIITIIAPSVVPFLVN